MTQFELLKEKVTLEVNGSPQTFELMPLTGEYLPLIYELMGLLKAESLDDAELRQQEMTQKITNPTFAKVAHKAVYETFRGSYPAQDETLLDRFVSQNLLTLLEPTINVNLANIS